MQRFTGKSVGFLIVKIGVTALFVVLANRSIHIADVSWIAGRVEPLHLALAFVLGVAGLLAQAARWHVVLRHQGLHSDLRTSLRTFLWGTALAFVTPGRVGEFARGLELAPQHKVQSVVAVFVDKLFAFGGCVLVAAVCASVQMVRHGTLVVGNWSWVAAFGGPALLFALLVRGKRRWVQFLPRWRIVTALEEVPGADSIDGSRMLVLSLLSQTLLLVQTAVVFSMFGCSGSAALILAAGLAYGLMTFLPFSIANIGVREYSFGMFLTTTGIALNGTSAAGAALGSSMVILALNVVLPAAVGLVWSLLEEPRSTGPAPCEVR